jgi:hypothetical protein
MAPQLVGLVAKLDVLTAKPLVVTLTEEQKRKIREKLQGLGEKTISAKKMPRALWTPFWKSSRMTKRRWRRPVIRLVNPTKVPPHFITPSKKRGMPNT